MAEPALTAEEYELHMRKLMDDLRALLERGEGKAHRLLREAEELLEMAEDYPAIRERYAALDGLLAETLARERQKKFMAVGQEREARGCLLGWLFGGGGKNSSTS